MENLREILSCVLVGIVHVPNSYKQIPGEPGGGSFQV